MASKTELSKQKILQTTFQIISKKGIAKTTVREIARQADISTGRIYHHFKDVSQIYSTLYMIHYNQIFCYLDTLEDSDMDPLTRFMSASTMSIQFLYSKKTFRDILYSGTYSNLGKGSDFFTLVRQNIGAVAGFFNLAVEEELLDLETFAFIGSSQALKSAFYSGQSLASPYEQTRFVFCKTFVPMGLANEEIEKRVSLVEQISRSTTGGQISSHWLLPEGQTVSAFDSKTLHEYGLG